MSGRRSENGDLYIEIFLTSTLSGGERPASRFDRLTPGKDPLIPMRFQVGWASEPVWTRWRKEKSQSGNEPLSSSL